MNPKILIVVEQSVAQPICATGEVEIHVVDKDENSPRDVDYLVEVVGDIDFDNEVKGFCEV